MNEINLSDMNWCKQKIDELQAENARLREELACTIDILEQTRLQFDAVSASNMRHVITQVRDLLAAAPKAQEGVPFKATVIFDDCTKIVEGVMPAQAEKQEPVKGEPAYTFHIDETGKAYLKGFCVSKEGDPLYTRPQPDLTAEVEFMQGKYEEMLAEWLPQKQRIAELEEAAREARDALQYHTAQTRPIFNTVEAIAKLDAVLGNAEGKPTPD